MALYTDMNIDIFHDIPLETPQSGGLPILPLRASFSVTRVSADASFTGETAQEPIFHGDFTWKVRVSGWNKENSPPSPDAVNGFTLSRISPLDALPLNLKALEAPWQPYVTAQDVDMMIDDNASVHSSSSSSTKSEGTLRERRLLQKSPYLKDLRIRVPPVHSDYVPASPLLIGSSDFIVWLDETVSSLYPSPRTAAEVRKCLLEIAGDPSLEGFEVVWSLFKDEELVEEFTNRLATHLIHFSDAENTDGLQSAWSDSTSSEIPEFDDLDDIDALSPSDVAMGVLETIDSTIEEVALAYTQWTAFSSLEGQEIELTEHHESAWL